MDYLGKGEVLTNTDLDRFVNNTWENRPFVYIEKVLDLEFSSWKMGAKKKVLRFIILVSVIALIHSPAKKPSDKF